MAEKLDLKDRRILYELEQDSRQSLNEIARKVRLKKETIFHRIRNLEKRGIIKQYTTEIDTYKLGYQYYPMLIRFQDTTPKIEDEIYEYLRKNRHMTWLTRCEGAWDINLTLIAKTIFEVNEFLDRFLSRYGRYIAEKQIFTSTRVYYFKRGFWLDKPSGETIGTLSEDCEEIEESDYLLLKILAGNARKPLIEIADELRTNPKNVAYRIKKLKGKGIIQGSRILVDFSKMGYKFYKVWFSLKNMNSENYKKLLDHFKHNPNIIWATKLIGCYDMSIEMEVGCVEDFRRVLGEIKEGFSNLIKKHESLLIFEESVMNYFP